MAAKKNSNFFFKISLFFWVLFFTTQSLNADSQVLLQELYNKNSFEIVSKENTKINNLKIFFWACEETDCFKKGASFLTSYMKSSVATEVPFHWIAPITEPTQVKSIKEKFSSVSFKDKIFIDSGKRLEKLLSVNYNKNNILIIVQNGKEIHRTQNIELVNVVELIKKNLREIK